MIKNIVAGAVLITALNLSGMNKEDHAIAKILKNIDQKEARVNHLKELVKEQNKTAIQSFITENGDDAGDYIIAEVLELAKTIKKGYKQQELLNEITVAQSIHRLLKAHTTCTPDGTAIKLEKIWQNAVTDSPERGQSPGGFC